MNFPETEEETRKWSHLLTKRARQDKAARSAIFIPAGLSKEEQGRQGNAPPVVQGTKTPLIVLDWRRTQHAHTSGPLHHIEASKSYAMSGSSARNCGATCDLSGHNTGNIQTQNAEAEDVMPRLVAPLGTVEQHVTWQGRILADFKHKMLRWKSTLPVVHSYSTSNRRRSPCRLIWTVNGQPHCSIRVHTWGTPIGILISHSVSSKDIGHTCTQPRNACVGRAGTRIGCRLRAVHALLALHPAETTRELPILPKQP